MGDESFAGYNREEQCKSSEKSVFPLEGIVMLHQ